MVLHIDRGSRVFAMIVSPEGRAHDQLDLHVRGMMESTDTFHLARPRLPAPGSIVSFSGRIISVWSGIMKVGVEELTHVFVAVPAPNNAPSR